MREEVWLVKKSGRYEIQLFGPNQLRYYSRKLRMRKTKFMCLQRIVPSWGYPNDGILFSSRWSPKKLATDRCAALSSFVKIDITNLYSPLCWYWSKIPEPAQLINTVYILYSKNKNYFMTSCVFIFCCLRGTEIKALNSIQLPSKLVN